MLVNGAPRGTAQFATHMEIGVPIFFVLSGFLLYRPWVAARVQNRPVPSARRYFRRRVARIVPAYWIALSAAAALGLSTGPIGHEPWIYYGFMQTYSARTFFNGLSPAWSLCVELSFYFALPLITLSFGRLAWRYQAAAATTVAASVLALRAATSYSDPTLSFTLLGTFDWFLVGMLVATLSVSHDHAVSAESVPPWRFPAPSSCGSYLELQGCRGVRWRDITHSRGTYSISSTRRSPACCLSPRSPRKTEAALSIVSSHLVRPSSLVGRATACSSGTCQ